mgnify:CR=1 FL=1|jgi:hypothetical protein
MDKEMYELYRQAEAEFQEYWNTMDPADQEYWDKLMDDMEREQLEHEAEEWVAIDRSNIYCTFMNRNGEVRTIGAQYIDDCFKGE